MQTGNKIGSSRNLSTSDTSKKKTDRALEKMMGA